MPSTEIPHFIFEFQLGLISWKTQFCYLLHAFHGTFKIKIKKFYLKSVHFITVQHKLSRAFQTDMHNKRLVQFVIHGRHISMPMECMCAYWGSPNVNFQNN